MLKCCEECGRPIIPGRDYLTNSTLLENKIFCSERCVKDWILENKTKEVVSNWIEDNTEEYQMESDDPYDRYGVSPGDFV